MVAAGQACPLCGSPGAPTGETVDGCPLRACCGVLLAWPHASVADYEGKYASQDAAYHDGEMRATGRQAFVGRDTEYLQTAIARLRLLRELYPRAQTLLDVGCGTGSLVANAGAFGFQAYGLEPCPVLVRWGQSMGRRVNEGGWEAVRGQWDLILLLDVLEHLTEPLAALERLREATKTGGAVVVEMPEYVAPGGEWQRHVKPREHPCLYSADAALALFARAGFRWDAITRPLGGTLAKIVFYLRRA